MPHLTKRSRVLVVAGMLGAGMLAAACRDQPFEAVPTSIQQPAGKMVGSLQCQVTVASGATRCRAETPSANPGGPSHLVVTDPWSMYWMVKTDNAQYNAPDSILALDVALENWLSTAIGTRDGTTALGFKLFMAEHPYVTEFKPAPDGSTPLPLNGFSMSDSLNTVRLLNPDGRQAFLAAGQPYFSYPEMLAPGAMSAYRTWRFHVPNTVSIFMFTVYLYAPAPGEAAVPDQAPDSIPPGFYNSANVMVNSPYFALSKRAVKGIVAVRFNETATRDERQAAVDMVGGTVVGGHRVNPAIEGSYFVQVTDDGSGAQVKAAIDALDVLPAVANVKAEYVWLPEEFAAWVGPEDDGDFTPGWQNRPSAANGDNWALEAIAAPDAWTCTTGSPATRMAVVDLGFFSNPDLTPNITYAPALDEYAALGYLDDWHGTAVASVIGARGNNQDGITGTMWNADLRLYDVSVADNGDRNTVKVLAGLFRTNVPVERLIQERLQQALSDGAHVINISLASTINKDSVPNEADWDKEISSAANELYHIIQGSANKPLIVLGAGNNGQDAFYSTFPYLASLLPDQAIVVGGVSAVNDASGTMWIKSGYNSSSKNYNLVQIAAPSKNVGVLSDDDTSQKDGTSFSAPLVSGIAGLLKSFDPRLTAKEIKQLLITGAQRGGRYVAMGGNVFVANAYQSLIAASERPGAPFCGGVPAWRDHELGNVQARKIVNGTAGELQVLFPSTGSSLVPFHTESTFGTDQGTFGWTNGLWAAHSTPRADLFGNATNRSKLGQSHNGDSTVTVGRVEVSNTQETYRVYINGSLLAEVPSTWAKKPATQVCARYDSGNMCAPIMIWTDRITSFPAVGYSPRGDEVVLAIWKQKSTYFAETPYPCSATDYCRDHGLEVTTLASELVFIRISDGQIVARRAGPVAAIKQIGYSEDGQRLVMGTEWTFSYTVTTTSTQETAHSANWYCQARYTTRSGTNLLTLPLKRQVPQCYTSATFVS
jgi:hypothetical protein